MLATIWHSRGQIEPAKNLILECLAGTLNEIKESKYESDRKMFSEEYQFHLQALVSLYPNAKDLLEGNKLPEDPLEWYYSKIDV